MLISVETLLKVIEDATMTKTILVPGTDYYCPGEPDQYTLEYIDPYHFTASLRSFLELCSPDSTV